MRCLPAACFPRKQADVRGDSPSAKGGSWASLPSMEPLPRSLGRYASLALAACAAVGLYLGASKSFGEGSTGLSGAGAASEGATSAKAIAPPPPPTFDEAAIRRIAKEEAQTLIAKAPSTASSSAGAGGSAPARRRSAASTRTYTTPSDAGLVYARPPGASDAAASLPPAPPSPPSGQVEQF